MFSGSAFNCTNVKSPSYDLVCDHPDVDEVLCFKKGVVLGAGSVLWANGFVCAGYDVAIDMHEGTRGSR